MPNQAEANLSALIESTEDLIWSVDREYRLITFNHALRLAFEVGFGITPLPGMLPQDLLPPERAALFPPFYERALAEGPFRAEYGLRDGRTVEMAFNPIVVGNEKIGISVFAKDITELKKTLDALREREVRLRDAERMGLAGSSSWDVDSDTTSWSEGMFWITGRDPNDPPPSHAERAKLYTAESWERLKTAVTHTLETGEPFDLELQIVRPDGVLRWTHARGGAVRNHQGRVCRIVGTLQDTTEQKLAEMKLRDSQERFRETFEQAAIGIIHLSFDGRILRCNRRFAAIVGYPLEELPGKTVQQLTPPEYLHESAGLLEQLVVTRSFTPSWEKCYVRKDGSRTWVKLASSVQRNGEGRPLHIVTFVEDINDRKAAERRLVETQEELRTSEARYRTVFQASLDGITITRLSDGKFIDVNDRYLEIIGYQRDEVIGSTSLQLGFWANPADRGAIVEALRRDSRVQDREARILKKNGESVWVLFSVALIEIEGISCILTLTRDISVAKAAEQQLAEAQDAIRTSEERYRTVFQTSLDGIAISRFEDGRYIDVNHAFLDIVGYSRDEVIGWSSLELGMWPDEKVRLEIADALRRNPSFRDLTIPFRRKNGEVFWMQLSASTIEIEGVPCVLSITRDTTDIRVAEEKIKDLAFYDQLTRLPNRRLLLERLKVAQIRDGGEPGDRALLFLDLDEFKKLNDTLGHEAGDLLLQEVARRLTACVRGADTVARCGGDEFAVLLEGLGKMPEPAATHAQLVANKIVAALSHPYLLAGRECHCRCSIGIAAFGGDQESPHLVLQQAELALHQAKTDGRNTMRFFAPGLQAAAEARADLEQDLHQAINKKQFTLYYQPQVDSAGLIGAEALIRWNHPARGLLFPAEFIGLAEETGLILSLGELALEAACSQIAAWAHRPETANIAVAVNISARQFRQPEFVSQVLAVLYRTGANPRNLELELTESTLLENVEDVIDKMAALKSHGLRFSLDDFGTGYSSLSYLKRLPLHRLKIDRAFVRDILVDVTSGAIAQTIVSLSRAMGLSVLAEGVETVAQRDFLVTLGCHAFQGYFFSHPLPLNEFEDWMSSQAAGVHVEN